MPTYISLLSWTDQGITAYKDSLDRYQAAQELAGQLGVTLTASYWTLGPYDVVVVSEAPDDETATAFALAVSSQGNVRTTTMRAFGTDEMRGIIAKTA
jgi:uncharacterized protein with GYD domain